MDDQILYEVADKVAVITLNRPEKANAQTMELLDDLDAAWEKAATDDEVRVIVLRGNGKHFSSGHDLSSGTARPEKITLDWIYKIEARKYLEYSLRWRNVPKPSIAAVQGKCIAGALLLVWPCDLIVAAENAQFSDPVVYLGIGGVEYHGHTWELGARKAKEILFTGRSVSAREAEQIGMVNKVVPLESLQDETMALAQRVAGTMRTGRWAWCQYCDQRFEAPHRKGPLPLYCRKWHRQAAYLRRHNIPNPARPGEGTRRRLARAKEQTP